MWRNARRNEQNLPQLATIHGSPRQSGVAEVDRIKRAAKQAYVHNTWKAMLLPRPWRLPVLVRIPEKSLREYIHNPTLLYIQRTPSS